MTNVAHLSAHNPSLVRQQVRAAYGRPFHNQMMFLMKSVVGFDGKLLPRFFWEPQFTIQSACNQAIVELPDRPHPIARVWDDLQALGDTDRLLKVNTQPRPIGRIYGRTSCAICPQDAPTLGVRPLTTLLQSSASIVTLARSLNRGEGAALCAISGRLSTRRRGVTLSPRFHEQMRKLDCILPACPVHFIAVSNVLFAGSLSPLPRIPRKITK
jgi:hypothetical protein